MGTTGGDRAKLVRSAIRRVASHVCVLTALTAAQEAEVSAAGAYAVIAPQMGKQLVAFQVSTRRCQAPGCCRSRLILLPCRFAVLAARSSQAAFEMIAARFPGAFAGYTLSVTEAHQSSKARVTHPVLRAR
jgi:hypothetical protein